MLHSAAKAIRTLSCSLIILTCCNSPSASQQAQTTGASLQDTFSWLSDFLPRTTGAAAKFLGDEGTETAKLSVISGCKVDLVITKRHDLPSGARKNTFYHSVFSFSDIDISRIKVVKTKSGTFTVEFWTRNLADLIDSYSGSDDHDKEALADVERFDDQANAERVAKAWRHATELCSKVEPF